MVNNTDCDALRLSRKLGTSSRRDDCARRTCDTETKMRSTERKFLPPETFFWYTAQPWANAQKVSAEKTNNRARTNRAREMYVGGVLSAHGVFANMRTLRNFFLLLKGETLQLKSREKRSLRFQDDSLSRISSFSSEILPPRKEERERALVVRFNKREKERRGGR